MENRIVRYGERGIVESIVLGIIEKSRTKQFLKAIRWSNSSKPEWIDDVLNTTWIVEIGLGQFGARVLCTSIPSYFTGYHLGWFANGILLLGF